MFPPKAMGETSSPELPNLCICILPSSNHWMLYDEKARGINPQITQISQIWQAEDYQKAQCITGSQ
jgi:hypothetical protein